MNLFDLELKEEIQGVADGSLPLDRLRTECIIALKAYDTMRTLQYNFILHI